jgi:hypothetical protein
MGTRIRVKKEIVATRGISEIGWEMPITGNTKLAVSVVKIRKAMLKPTE